MSFLKLKRGLRIDKMSEEEAFLEQLMYQNNGVYYNFRNWRFYPKESISKKPYNYSALLGITFKHIPLYKRAIKDVRFIYSKWGNETPFNFAVNKQNENYFIEYHFFSKKNNSHDENKTFEKVKPILTYLNDEIDFEKIAIDVDFYMLSIIPGDDKKQEEFHYFSNIILPNKPIRTDDMGYIVNIDSIYEEGFCYDLLNYQTRSANKYYGFTRSEQIWDMFDKLIEITKSIFPNEDSALAKNIFKLPYLNTKLKELKGCCIPIVVAPKFNAVGLYFHAIDFKTFIHFLQYHEYSENFISDLIEKKNQLEHLLFDIKVDFILRNNEFIIKKTGFYGAF
jgi:hypothetical protein